MKKLRRRKECFLGFHTDFHAKPQDGVVIGATLDEKDIREICETIKPDYIQIDCKGHPGWTSYPSKLGNAMPEFIGDPLEVWRRITLEYDIPLYMHYSGVYDIKYCKEHPEEAVMNADGTYSEEYVRLDGKYVDELLIPQVCELVEKYHINGIWIDGDCWGVRPDYRPETIERFEKLTGISLDGNLPVEKGDKYFREYMDFTRDRFREYLRYYVDALHTKYPELEICSNWVFSAFMPEPKCADVDFISGDLTPLNCLNNARFASRMVAIHDTSWDVMSWGHRYLLFQEYRVPTQQPKHPVQLKQEAASIISLGGGYQCCFIQYFDGTPNMKRIRRYKEVADFVRERKPYCFNGKPIHQAGVLVSTHDKYETMKRPFFGAGNDEYIGIISLLCNAGQSAEVVNDSIVENECEKYPLIVVPELAAGLKKSTIDALRKYVENGGNLLLVGANTSRIFAENGFGFEVQTFEKPFIVESFTANNGHEMGRTEGKRHPAYFSLDEEDFGTVLDANIIKKENSQILSKIYNYMRYDGETFASMFDYGKGKIGVIGAAFGLQYREGQQHLHTKLVKEIAERMYEPIAKVEASCGHIEIVALEKDGKLMLQLMNSNGNHGDILCITEDNIPPAVDIKLSVRTETEPKKLVLHPAEKEIPFKYENGRAVFTVDRVDIHEIVEFIM